MLGYRSNDAVLTICQNNSAKSIEIIDISEAASAAIGYSRQELAGRLLSAIIPMRLSTLLLEYVEYHDNANDVGAVLSKVQNFSLLGKDGKEKNFRMKMVRGQSTRDQQHFLLVLHDVLNTRRDDALHKLIQENFKGHEVLHPTLAIPNRQSLEKDIELITYYHHKAGLSASLVTLQIDHLAALKKQYESLQSEVLLKHSARICRENLRPGDVISAINDTHIGVLLLDAIADSTRMVANRLRWQVAAQPYSLANNTMLNLTASMSYANIDGSLPAKELIDATLHTLNNLPEDATSQLVEAALK